MPVIFVPPVHAMTGGARRRRERCEKATGYFNGTGTVQQQKDYAQCMAPRVETWESIGLQFAILVVLMTLIALVCAAMWLAVAVSYKALKFAVVRALKWYDR